MPQTWILVADGSHARLFHAAEISQPWRLVKKLDREHGRVKTSHEGSHEERGEHDFARQDADYTGMSDAELVEHVDIS